MFWLGVLAGAVGLVLVALIAAVLVPILFPDWFTIN